MRSLVTGASGHLGSYLTRLLLRRGHEVAVLVRPQSNLWRLVDLLPQVRIIPGDLRDIDSARNDLLKIAPHIVFHLAWYGITSEARNDPNQIYWNLLGSLRLLQIAQEAGINCWLGLGSQAEYGPWQGRLHEDLPTKPVTIYGATKLCVSLLSQQLCDKAGTRYLWLRLLATYGPQDDVRHLIPTVILKLLAGEKPALTPGEQKWDYLYVEDAAEAIYRLAMQPEAHGIYNLGSGEAQPVRRIVEDIRNLIDPHLPIGFGEVPYRPDQVMHLQTDIGRLHRATGWLPEVSLREGLSKTIEWYRDHPNPFGA